MMQSKKQSKKKLNSEYKRVLSARESILSTNTPFAITEAYRTARTNILKLPIEDTCKKIAITSSKAGEGKTVTAINLSIILAQDGYKVLLIDADLRKPQIKRYLKLQSKIGLVEYLLGKQSFMDIAKSNSYPLHILASNTSYAYPAEILTKNRMVELIRQFNESFDYIIIDTPPLDYVTDSAVLSDLVNGYLFVAKAGYSKTSQIEDSIHRLEMIDANILGFFLNNIDPKKCHYGSRYQLYNYYGSYKYHKYPTHANEDEL